MSRATITISTNADGGLDMLTHYDGGYTSDDPAHQAALLLSAKMGELAEPRGPAREPTPEERAQIQGLAEPMRMPGFEDTHPVDQDMDDGTVRRIAESEALQ